METFSQFKISREFSLKWNSSEFIFFTFSDFDKFKDFITAQLATTEENYRNEIEKLRNEVASLRNELEEARGSQQKRKRRRKIEDGPSVSQNIFIFDDKKLFTIFAYFLPIIRNFQMFINIQKNTIKSGFVSQVKFMIFSWSNYEGWLRFSSSVGLIVAEITVCLKDNQVIFHP